MWCLETIQDINQEAAKLAREGKQERDAQKNCGVCPCSCKSQPKLASEPEVESKVA